MREDKCRCANERRPDCTHTHTTTHTHRWHLETHIGSINSYRRVSAVQYVSLLEHKLRIRALLQHRKPFPLGLLGALVLGVPFPTSGLTFTSIYLGLYRVDFQQPAQNGRNSAAGGAGMRSACWKTAVSVVHVRLRDQSARPLPHTAG